MKAARRFRQGEELPARSGDCICPAAGTTGVQRGRRSRLGFVVITYRSAGGEYDAMSVSQADFRKALGCFATGITVITLDSDNEVHGMTANAFASVSLDPMLVLVCVDQRARTHAHLHAKKRFGVNVLSENQRAISEYYARPARTHDRAARGSRRGL